MAQSNNEILAQVIIKSDSPLQLGVDTALVTSENIQQFKPSKRKINRLAKLMEKDGFTVEKSDLTLSISASPSLFEQCFETKVEKNQHGDFEVKNEIKIPEKWKKLIQSIELTSSPEFY